jgi:hypothetical protein
MALRFFDNFTPVVSAKRSVQGRFFDLWILWKTAKVTNSPQGAIDNFKRGSLHTNPTSSTNKTPYISQFFRQKYYRQGNEERCRLGSFDAVCFVSLCEKTSRKIRPSANRRILRRLSLHTITTVGYGYCFLATVAYIVGLVRHNRTDLGGQVGRAQIYISSKCIIADKRTRVNCFESIFAAFSKRGCA